MNGNLYCGGVEKMIDWCSAFNQGKNKANKNYISFSFLISCMIDLAYLRKPIWQKGNFIHNLATLQKEGTTEGDEETVDKARRQLILCGVYSANKQLS